MEDGHSVRWADTVRQASRSPESKYNPSKSYNYHNNREDTHNNSNNSSRNNSSPRDRSPRLANAIPTNASSSPSKGLSRTSSTLDDSDNPSSPANLTAAFNINTAQTLISDCV